MDARDVDAINRKKIAEDDAVLVYCASEVRTHAPVGDEALVARGLGGYVVAGMRALDRREHAQDSVCIADIDDQEHKFVIGDL